MYLISPWGPQISTGFWRPYAIPDQDELMPRLCSFACQLILLVLFPIMITDITSILQYIDGNDNIGVFSGCHNCYEAFFVWGIHQHL